MSKPQELFVISITTRDRVGIIYEVTKAISELGGNIADIRQSILCGYFTMILLASFPADTTQRSIERKLAEADSNSESAIEALVRKADDGVLASSTPTPETAYVLTATGYDRIGFVATITSFCAQNDINIIDLSTTISDDAYVMILVIDLNHIESISDMRRELQTFSQENGIQAVLQHYDIFRAVNEINLPVR
ncbi:MAG TPA: ACT domain-containing protein [Anaerolineales bacterium]|nr:ACT domain-containing protein [Anaerolineales bacterium]